MPDLTRRAFCFLGAGVAIVGALDPWLDPWPLELEMDLVDGPIARARILEFQVAGAWLLRPGAWAAGRPRSPLEIPIRYTVVYTDSDGNEVGHERKPMDPNAVVRVGPLPAGTRYAHVEYTARSQRVGDPLEMRHHLWNV